MTLHQTLKKTKAVLERKTNNTLIHSTNLDFAILVAVKEREALADFTLLLL